MVGGFVSCASPPFDFAGVYTSSLCKSVSPHQKLLAAQRTFVFYSIVAASAYGKTRRGKKSSRTNYEAPSHLESMYYEFNKQKKMPQSMLPFHFKQMEKSCNFRARQMCIEIWEIWNKMRITPFVFLHRILIRVAYIISSENRSEVTNTCRRNRLFLVWFPLMIVLFGKPCMIKGDSIKTHSYFF